MLKLPWFDNGDRLAVAIAANAAARAGMSVWRALADDASCERGDYILDAGNASPFTAHGLKTEPCAALPANARRIVAPRIALLAGACSAYPYYGYYALALMRLGFVFSIVDGSDIAGGALDRHDLLILPGGFSNWTLDLKEKTSGADDAVRRFLQRGGSVIGSCGGGYYLSRGRQGWLGVADARPLNTQEYLRTGVGIVTCTLDDADLALGLPPTLEIAYFHGPVWDTLGADTQALATFRDYYGHGALFIQNPLSRDIFERDMRGRAAALRSSGRRGASVLFSPHPEMGDLLRKYMALETYIARYLPIRGDLVMRETLATFRPEESRSFLMILNAVDMLARTSPMQQQKSEAAAAQADIPEFVRSWKARAATFSASAGAIGALETELLEDLQPRLERAVAETSRRAKNTSAILHDMLARLCADMTVSLHQRVARRPAENLLELELACLMVEAWATLASFDGLT